MKLVLYLVIGMNLFCQLHAKPYQFQGLERSKESFVRSLLSRCFAADEDPTDEQIERCLFNSRLFAQINISRTADQTVITVEEKWTLIPIPNFQSSKTDNRYGLLLLESNLFGLGHFLLVGGSVGKKSKSGLFLFTYRNIAASRYFANISLFTKSQDLERYRGEEIIDQLQESRESVRLAIGRDLFEKSRLSLGLANEALTYESLTEAPALTGYRSQKWFLRLVIDQRNFRLFYDDGWELNTRFESQIRRDDDGPLESFLDITLHGSQPFFNERLILKEQIRSLAIKPTGDPRSFLAVGKTRGFRGIPDTGAWVKQATGLAFDALTPLWHTSRGTLTSGLFWDHALLEEIAPPSRHRLTSSNGYGFSLYFFIKQVAVPGFGLEMGQNRPYSDFFAQVSIGAGF